MKERILGSLAERWPWVRTAMRVQDRFSELHGTCLASAVTLAAFVSLFPLLLAVIGVVGVLSVNATNLAGDVITRLGLSGEAATALRSAIRTAESTGRAASVVGVLGLLWTGLGLVAALQFTFDSVWQVSGRGLRDKLYGLLWLAGASVVFVASFVVTALLRLLPGPARVPGIALGLAVDIAVMMWTFRALTNRDVGWRALLSGAILGGVGLEVLKVAGGIYVPMLVRSSSALYGSIGVVFAILAWLLILGKVVVYAAVLNVVRWEEDHGTVTAEIELPRIPNAVPVMATRAGEEQPA